ncbi:MAG: lysophospholipid acyltransferase family protein [Gammaproteobacteria bacterium]
MRRLLRNPEPGKHIASLLLRGLLRLLWSTCRVRTVIGAAHSEQLLQTGKPFIPCYWHQQHIFCSYYLFQLKKQGLKLGFLISPSADGEIAARVVESWGAQAIRGSATRTGAKAMRDMYHIVVKQGISPATTSDGPQGPAQKFKAGAVMLAQLTQAPMLPMACAASRAWYLKSWDRFMIPKPFSTVVIALGAPQTVDKTQSLEHLQPLQDKMEHSINDLMAQAQSALADV